MIEINMFCCYAKDTRSWYIRLLLRNGYQGHDYAFSCFAITILTFARVGTFPLVMVACCSCLLIDNKVIVACCCFAIDSKVIVACSRFLVGSKVIVACCCFAIDTKVVAICAVASQ
jgi:hypothetical protein